MSKAQDSTTGSSVGANLTFGAFLWPKRWIQINKASSHSPSGEILTIAAGHLQVSNDPEDVVHLVRSLFIFHDAARGRVCRINVDQIQKVDS